MRLAGLVLAGGAGSRLGAGLPKPLVPVGGTTPLAVAIARLAPHCDPVLVSANDAAAFAGLELPLLPDRRPERLGPLAGLEAAADHLARLGAGITHLACLPGDTPFLPADLVPRLARQAGECVVIAASSGRLQPTVALWPLGALSAITTELDRPDGERSLMAIIERCGLARVDFTPDPAAPGGDPFFNVNTPDDLETARKHLG